MTSVVEERTYRVPEVCRTLGISYRQLDYWCRVGVATDRADGSGSRRRFTEDDMWRLRVASRLMTGHQPQGFHVGEVRSLLDGEMPTSRLRLFAETLTELADEIDARRSA